MKYHFYLKTEEVTKTFRNQNKYPWQWYYKFIISILFLSSFYSSKAQQIPEFGISFGSTQYMGDLNTGKLFYQPSLAGSAVFIINLNQRTGIKTGISYFGVKGIGNLHYNGITYDFDNRFLSYQVSYFINFLDYDFGVNKDNFSPYFSIGAGYSNSLKGVGESHFVIPFGPGIKYLIKNKVSIGLEYTFYRAFTDQVDGKHIRNYGDDQKLTDSDKSLYPSNIGNSDWYSYLSLVITFKFINFAGDCPAYY